MKENNKQYILHVSMSHMNRKRSGLSHYQQSQQIYMKKLSGRYPTEIFQLSSKINKKLQINNNQNLFINQISKSKSATDLK